MSNQFLISTNITCENYREKAGLITFYIFYGAVLKLYTIQQDCNKPQFLFFFFFIIHNRNYLILELNMRSCHTFAYFENINTLILYKMHKTYLSTRGVRFNNMTPKLLFYLILGLLFVCYCNFKNIKVLFILTDMYISLRQNFPNYTYLRI